MADARVCLPFDWQFDRLPTWQEVANPGTEREGMSELLTLREVMDLLRIGERTVYEMCRTGRLPGALKVGGQWRVRRGDLEAWLRERSAPETDNLPASPGDPR